MAAPFLVRTADAGDAGAFGALWAQHNARCGVEYDAVLGLLPELLTAPGAVALVCAAPAGGLEPPPVVGGLLALPDGAGLHLCQLLVAEGHQRRGAGRALMRVFAAAAAGRPFAWLQVQRAGPVPVAALARFYAEYGFAPVPGDDPLLMARGAYAAPAGDEAA